MLMLAPRRHEYNLRFSGHPEKRHRRRGESIRTSTAEQNGFRCPKCDDETTRDPNGSGFVRHKSNRRCKLENGQRDQIRGPGPATQVAPPPGATHPPVRVASEHGTGVDSTSRIYVPANGPDAFRLLLAEPVKHWKTGYSAKSLAYSWWEAQGFPEEVRESFAASDHVAFRKLEPLVIIPEHKVDLPGGKRPSQNDLFVLARGAGKLFSISVEGKVRETFDELVGDWLGDSPSEDKKKRLQFLVDKLGIDGADAGRIRYQLLHRTVSALIEAERFNAPNAMLLVHSFSQDDEHFGDYSNFLRLFGIAPKLNTVHGPVGRNDKNLYFCWVRGRKEYLTR
jgi:hypothetical protein